MQRWTSVLSGDCSRRLNWIDVRKRLLTGEELVKNHRCGVTATRCRRIRVGKPPAPCIYNFPFHRSKRTVLETRLSLGSCFALTKFSINQNRLFSNVQSSPTSNFLVSSLDESPQRNATVQICHPSRAIQRHVCRFAQREDLAGTKQLV